MTAADLSTRSYLRVNQYSVGEASKAFPTVGEVLTDPFIKMGKRLQGLLAERPAAGGAKRDVYALRDVSAVLEPARLYLVIGGPKSGKTSFLKAVAGGCVALRHA